ncbi:hypothetical protein [Natronomonas marina]|jgi:hypothetical protein|uniref:hypothetical protein n=1 Tax=Natronomonas marina TaxID=2961939 RepID=UPI0020C9959F|nr:hypothetical protein [Natronomonas marina]
MREITQVVVAAVGLAVFLPLVTVAAFHLDVGIPFIAALFLFVSVFVLLYDRVGGGGGGLGTEE